MIDIYKQIDYWRIGAKEDWVVAKKLIADESLRHGLFFAHLTLEKILKALVCQATQNLAPRIHSLTRLAEIAALSMHVDYARILGEMNDFNLIGRYPEFDLGILTVVEAHYYIEADGGGLSMAINGVDSAVIEVIQRYLFALKQQGIPVAFGVLFGSQVTGNIHVWSDIDLLVVSPQFDEHRRRKDIDLLWHVATFVDTRIEPIGIGERQWVEDDASAIIEIARRTGVVIALASEAALA